MSRVRPARWRDGDEGVGEVDESVDGVPVREAERGRGKRGGVFAVVSPPLSSSSSSSSFFFFSIFFFFFFFFFDSNLGSGIRKHPACQRVVAVAALEVVAGEDARDGGVELCLLFEVEGLKRLRVEVERETEKHRFDLVQLT